MEKVGTVLSAEEHDKLLEHKRLSLEKDRLLEEAKAVIVVLESMNSELTRENLALSNQLRFFYDLNDEIGKLITDSHFLRLKQKDSKPNIHEFICKINNAQKPVTTLGD
jgi:aminopeptidase N